jgi:dihydrofolate reductase
MARLIYSAIASLDGYIADEQGGFDWSAPDDEVHAFANDLLRPVGTQLYGRRMYEVMRAWETMAAGPDEPVIADFARLWRESDKVVYSRTLTAVSTARTRLARDFDAAAIGHLKATAPRDLSVGGAGLAAHAFAAGLVDDIHLLLSPIIVGGGTAALPAGVRAGLELASQRRFGNGVVHLHYRVAQST